MSNIYKYNQNEKATVCASNSCVTVYGNAAKIINVIAISVVVFSAVVFIAKALK